MQNGEEFIGGTAISVDYVTVSRSNLIQIGRFHSYQAYIDDLTVGTLHGGGSGGGIPSSSTPNGVWGGYGPVTIPATGVNTTIADVILTQGSWLISLMVSGTGATPSDLAQWRQLVSASVSVAGAVTIISTVSNDAVTNGQFTSTPGTALVCTTGAPFEFKVQVNSTIAGARWYAYVQSVASV
jgi:hypothetical protein